MIRDESLEAFLESVASSSPTPGGGSVAAAAGATGAALIAMVARLTAGREGFEALDERMREIAGETDEARSVLLDLADRDAHAFDAVMEAFKMPKATDPEKSARSAAIQTAFEGAAAVPLEVAHLSAGLLAMAVEVIETGNPDAASDGLSAGATLFASVLCALANVEINAGSLKDATSAEALREEASALSARARELLSSAELAFRSRIGG